MATMMRDSYEQQGTPERQYTDYQRGTDGSYKRNVTTYPNPTSTNIRTGTPDRNEVRSS
jgi:hypothetical protein